MAALSAALAPDRVHADPAARHLAARDGSIYAGGAAGPVCFPESAAEVQACVRIAAAHDRPVVARGAGTGLAGGAVPLANPVVVVTTRLDRILSVEPADRVAWVEPGVVNLDLVRHLAPLGWTFAPDPSSQQVCTIGGNIANNSGGPHCLADGVTSAHVLAVDVVTSDGSLVRLGGVEADQRGYDLRGAFVGSEGLFGIAVAAAVRLTRLPERTSTFLIAFESARACADTVGAVIAAGVVPAAMEMMDRRCVELVEAFVHAGYPTDAAAVLLAEVAGPPGAVEAAGTTVTDVARRHGAVSVRRAADEHERQLLWKGRKNAFGAVARLAPDYYLHDTVVPRHRLGDVLAGVEAIAERHDLAVLNVFHAGDGNLHPILAYDARHPGALDRVLAAGREIVELSLAAGGVLSGEHGIGVEKRDYMSLLFTATDLDLQGRLRSAFDPHCRLNPGKVLPEPHSCADIGDLRRASEAVWG